MKKLYEWYDILTYTTMQSIYMHLMSTQILIYTITPKICAWTLMEENGLKIVNLTGISYFEIINLIGSESYLIKHNYVFITHSFWICKQFYNRIHACA